MARRKTYACSDRMCGATDCQTCYPGNTENDPCAECGEVQDNCECEEFVAAEDDDEPEDDRHDQDRDDYEADRAADAYEDNLTSGW